MSESEAHRILVEHLKDEICAEFAKDQRISIRIDLDNTPNKPAPEKLNGNIPDLYAEGLNSKLEIVGEAKTFKDFDKPRSILQIKNFVDYTSKRDDAYFCLCVPYEIEIYAEAIVHDMASQMGLSQENIRIYGMM